MDFLVLPYLEPCKHSYGGPALFLCLPLSTFYGLLTGLGVSVFGSSQRKYGGVCLIVVSLLTLVITFYWWKQFEDFNDCNSKYVLFYPLILLSVLIGISGTFLANKGVDSLN